MLLPNLLQRFQKDCTLKESYEWNRIVWNQYRWDLSACQYCISPFAYRSMWILNTELRKLLCWINYNIIRNIDIDSLDTINVKLRIATCMLNKIDIDDVYKIEIHYNLVKNVREEYYNIQLSELPF